MTNVIALCIGFCSLVLFTYLLRASTLGAASYVTLLITTALVSIAIARVDVIELLDLKNMRLEVQRAREDVYAKVEELQRTAAGVASFTAASIVNENRFVGLDHAERMLRRRDELERFLKDTGVAETRREELLRPITMMVDWDLRRAIDVNAVAAWRVPPGMSPNDSSLRDAMQRELETILQKADRPAALTEATEFLTKRGIASESLSSSIAQYRQMLTTGRLPRYGSTEDIRKAPIDY